MEYLAYSFDPRRQEAQCEDYPEERTRRFLNPTAQVATWQREDGERELLTQTYEILGCR